MQEFEKLLRTPILNQPISPLYILISLVAGAALAYSIALVYMKTHEEEGYTQSFVQALVFISIIVAAVMLVIGNNIARAFGLIGAVAIIRFRTRVKGPKDTTFLFFSIVIGMACGLRLYPIAFIATAFVNSIILGLWKIRFGEPIEKKEKILEVKLKNPDMGKKLVSPCLEEETTEWEIVEIKSSTDGTTIKYKVKLKKYSTPDELIQKLKERVKKDLISTEYHTVSE